MHACQMDILHFASLLLSSQVLIWVLFLNRKQEMHLQQVFAEARTRQYFLAASDGADLGENHTVCFSQWRRRASGASPHMLYCRKMISLQQQRGIYFIGTGDG